MGSIILASERNAYNYILDDYNNIEKKGLICRVVIGVFLTQ